MSADVELDFKDDCEFMQGRSPERVAGHYEAWLSFLKTLPLFGVLMLLVFGLYY